MIRGAPVLVTAAVLAMCLTGCGTEPLLPAEATVGLATADDGAVLEVAQAALIARCMTSRGFSYPLDPAALRARLARPSTSTASAPPREPPSSSAPAFTTALYGDPAAGVITVTLPSGDRLQQSRDGCNAEAQHALFGDRQAYLRGRLTADNLGPLVHARVIAQPAFAAAERKVRACLDRAGWAVTNRCDRGPIARLTAEKEQEVRAELAPLLSDLTVREQQAARLARRLLTTARQSRQEDNA
ncbi:hypothetical protein AB0M02_26495 [Actinoplanes sp. NPDC051861]|uniref:hypothetical protein n=1 Tax=Actinoplanes sp. NPDC051861 TaxID=3155170 RepID=UPI0034489778